ncbi:hypothetical protein [Lentilitoribacter sp. Alg239-R112]|uniref:hypothetical protein n=1 Tax=Lentilitoribacter sp. Alg239-R112 TaxID=2305987 RepID=UPI0013A70044|nr:hypothetical protein [Lentilitoribacter sp. Alg239-R112]
MKKYTILSLAMLAVPIATTHASAFVGHGDAETREEATQIAMDHCRRNAATPERCRVVREVHNPRVNATDWRVVVSTAK